MAVLPFERMASFWSPRLFSPPSASFPGRLASFVTSRCTPLGCSSFGQLPKFEAGHVNGTCQIVYRQQLKTMLASAQWRTVSWRSGTKGRLKARFAAVRVRTADGPPQRIWDKGQQHLPGDEAWLIGEHRASGEKKYYLANWPPEWTSAA